MAHKFNVAPAETLAANKTFTQAEVDEYTIFNIDPNGARDLTLPAVAANEGQFLIVKNSAGGAEVMTFKNVGGDTIVTPTQNESAIIWCDGTVWAGIAGANS